MQWGRMGFTMCTASSAIRWSNVEQMQLVPSADLVSKFTTNASIAIWWPNLKPMQVAPSGGQIYN